MVGSKAAEGYRRFHQDISDTLAVGVATGDTTLVTARNASHTIYVQRIIAYVNTDAAQSWSFEDSNSTPKEIAQVTASPGDETRWDFDFGDIGVPLTEGKNLVLDVSAAGLGGHVEWYGYQKLTAVVAAASA